MTNVIAAITYTILTTNWVPVDFKGPDGYDRRDIGVIIEETYLHTNLKGVANTFLIKAEIKGQPLIKKWTLELGTNISFTPNFNFRQFNPTNHDIWQQ